MIEQIGKIVIDDTHYPGEDLYSDGAVEDEILEIVKSFPQAEYGKVIEERRSWPVFYHLSPLRENIVDWVPVKKDAKVLEVGSGCGAITGALARKAGSVTCIELSKKRSLINAYRHPECDNVTIKLGNFQDVEPELSCDYDYIFLIGVFEYAQSYIGGENPFETFMAIMLRHLKEGGSMAIAIENRFGLKYWAGCREDHLGTYFSGLEGYPEGGNVRTFTKKGLEEICKANGVGDYAFYYPYPDYKFMTTLYSDDRLPKLGELSDNMRNFDRDRLLLFDEKAVFDSIIKEEVFPLYTNSYMLLIGKTPEVKYVRYSNDRAPQFAVCTEILEQDGRRQVEKRALYEEAKAHVRHIEEAYLALSEIYQGSGLLVNHCEIKEDRAVLAYLSGKTLEELLDECLDKGNTADFYALTERYMEFVRLQKNKNICNYDFIFSNIIIDGASWHLIDYEWTFENDGSYSPDEVICRALYCYGLGSEKRKKLSYNIIKKEFGYDENAMDRLVTIEKEFQKYVTGRRMSTVEIRNAIGMPIIPAAFLGHRYAEELQRNRIQVYEDKGEGFREEESCFVLEGYREKEALSVKLSLAPDVKAVRIDPCIDFCMVTVKDLRVNGEEWNLSQKNIILNGNLISENTVIFATTDPGITVMMPKGFAGEGSVFSVKNAAKEAGEMQMDFEVIRISQDMAESLSQDGNNKKQGRTGKWFGK